MKRILLIISSGIRPLMYIRSRVTGKQQVFSTITGGIYEWLQG